jgi:hypothetical protein
MMKRKLKLLYVFLSAMSAVDSFSLVMMGARRGKGDLKKAVAGEPLSSKKANPVNSLNLGKGQEITGVSLPADGKQVCGFPSLILLM